MKERNGNSSARGELQAASVSSEMSQASPEARGLSQTMRDPARRKRIVRPKAKSRCQPGSESAPTDAGLQRVGNGGESSSFTKRANGVIASGAAMNGQRNTTESAASDDATGTTLAGDATSAAACSGRDACAEVAASRSAGCGSSEAVPGESSGSVDDRRPRACDDAPLAFDAPGFVDEMHARVNLYVEYQKLLEADDLKVKQRALELLLEMKYARGASESAEEVPRIDFGDLPRPQR
jgi:hypothetical protein